MYLFLLYFDIFLLRFPRNLVKLQKGQLAQGDTYISFQRFHFQTDVVHVSLRNHPTDASFHSSLIRLMTFLLRPAQDGVAVDSKRNASKKKKNFCAEKTLSCKSVWAHGDLHSRVCIEVTVWRKRCVYGSKFSFSAHNMVEIHRRRSEGWCEVSRGEAETSVA